MNHNVLFLFTNTLVRDQRCPQPVLGLNGKNTVCPICRPTNRKRKSPAGQPVSAELVRTRSLQVTNSWGEQGWQSRTRVGTVPESSSWRPARHELPKKQSKGPNEKPWQAVMCHFNYKEEGRCLVFYVVVVGFLAHQYDELSRPKPHSGSFQVCFAFVFVCVCVCGIYWSRPKNQTNRTGMQSF